MENTISFAKKNYCPQICKCPPHPIKFINLFQPWCFLSKLFCWVLIFTTHYSTLWIEFMDFLPLAFLFKLTRINLHKSTLLSKENLNKQNKLINDLVHTLTNLLKGLLMDFRLTFSKLTCTIYIGSLETFVWLSTTKISLSF